MREQLRQRDGHADSSVGWIADSALPQGKDPAKGLLFTANADPTSLASGSREGSVRR